MVLRPQRILSLCSGAGGLDLGVHDALGGRARTVVFVEHEVTACEVLAARIADHALDDAPIWGDLHAFDARGWRGRVDGIIGGYPCQPFSVAGKRLGTADPRHLWPSIARIITECEPTWCFFENVAGHLRLGYFDVVRPDLERLGYRVTEGLFTAAEVGATHQRERLFILAHRDPAGSGGAGPAGAGILADAENDHGRRGEWGTETGIGPGGIGRRRLTSGSSELADATLGGQRECGELSGGAGQPDGRDARMADARDGAVDDPERLGGRSGHGGREDAANAYTPGQGLPAFPPGPSDRDAWSRILRDYPDLTPALSRWDVLTNALRSRGFVPPQHSGKNRRARRLEEQKAVARARGRVDDEEEPLVHPSRLPAATQSELHGMADGLEAGMDLSRAARLRITGNGVVPQCASLAFRTLWGQLADTGHTERTGGAGDEE